MVASKPPRAVLRIAKVKSLSALDRLSRHDTRAQPVANDDPERGGVVWLTEATDPAAAVRAGIADLDKPPPKKGVLAYQVVLTTSAEWFGEGPDREAKAKAFTEAALALAKDNLPGRLVAGCRHDGEAAPHLHLYYLPEVASEVAVNRKRPELGKKPCRRLAYSELFGRNMAECRATLTRLQDGIGQALAPLGIERGVPRSVSHADHKTTQAWKAEQAAAAKEAVAVLAAQKAAAAEQQRLNDEAALWLAEAQDRAAKAAKREAAAAVAQRQADKARTDAEAFNRKARADQAVEAAKIAGLDAFSQGILIDAEGPSGYLRPVFAPGVGVPEQAAVEKAIAPDRQGVLQQIAMLAIAVRATVADKVRELLRAMHPSLSIQAARHRAEQETARFHRIQRPPRQRQAPEREL